MANRKRSTRRRKQPQRITLRSICIVAVISIGIWAVNAIHGCNDSEPQTQQYGAYGNLMEVVTNPSLPSKEKSYTGMDISFNPKLHVPNWVSWELTSDEVSGNEGRANKFFSDPDVDGCPDPWDYSYSGYDRGHMAPAGDMKWSKKAMEETFYLTNICPQVHALNNGTWKKVEEKCRTWATKLGQIYIVCGPVIEPGCRDEYIGDSRVWVPKRFFNVVIAPYTNKPLGIGFLMPNGKVSGGMQACVVSIDEIEELTGHDFFSTLPDDMENEIETQANLAQWELLKNK